MQKIRQKNLPARPFAGMTQIRFKGFGLRHLSPLQDTPRRQWLYDNFCQSTIGREALKRHCLCCQRAHYRPSVTVSLEIGAVAGNHFFVPPE